MAGHAALWSSILIDLVLIVTCTEAPSRSRSTQAIGRSASRSRRASRDCSPSSASRCRSRSTIAGGSPDAVATGRSPGASACSCTSPTSITGARNCHGRDRSVRRASAISWLSRRPGSSTPQSSAYQRSTAVNARMTDSVGLRVAEERGPGRMAQPRSIRLSGLTPTDPTDPNGRQAGKPDRPSRPTRA